MARFLMGTIPVVGHVSPGIAIARALVERGHEVWWYTGRVFQQTVEATGARFVPITAGLDYSDPQNVPQVWTEQRNALKGAAQLKFDLKHFFIDAALGQCKDLTEILKTFPADVLLTDCFFLGAAWICEQGGPPWAEFGVSALGFSSQDTAPFGLGLQPSASWLGRLRNWALNRLTQRMLLGKLTTYTRQTR
jgi:UDP:flavonoid glycosyltransferase YjiC (YdhE family)